MSIFKVEQCCFDLGNSSNATKFKEDPDSFLSNYSLTEAEKQAVKNGDLGALYKLGVVYNAIMGLSRVCGYDNVTYVRKLREAAGLPEIKEQIDVLQKRANTRRG